MDRDALFVETVKDLHHKLRDDASDYELLRASALMRQLFLDESPLYIQVRKRRQRSVTFRWVELRTEEFTKRGIPIPNALAIGFAVDSAEGYPDGVMCAYHAAGQEASFLQAIIGFHVGRPLTVRDAIKLAANVEGGVHAGAVRKHEEGQQTMRDLRAFLESDIHRMALNELTTAFGVKFDERELPGGPSTLRGIGRVIVRGLKPLFDEVRSDVE